MGTSSKLDRCKGILLTAILLVQSFSTVVCCGAGEAGELQSMVEADWAAQEKRKGRVMYAPAAVRDAFTSAERLIGNLREMPDGPPLDSERAALDRLRSEVERIDSLNTAGRLGLYLKIR
ncbi:MAG: hypothetical protein ACYS8Z_21215, partial [Planctomycetota bacterium]